MSKVKLKGGKAETLLAKALWHQGYRYRKNDKKLPGSPDIAILKHRIAVFVDGEFWHGKDWENRKTRLKSNREYWIEKIEENMARDLRDDQLLMQDGWVPIHFWEKEVIKDLSTCVATIEEVILAQLIDSADTQEAIDYGQHGTARWATKQEIRQTYAHIPFEPELWRKGEHLPEKQGLILGCEGPKNHVTALVDTDDIHAMVTAASGAGKTAFFL